MDSEMGHYLRATSTIEAEHEKIIETVTSVTRGCVSDEEKAVGLFYFVRDSIKYNIYMISVFIEDFKASRILEWGKAYCVQKAVLLTALGRAAGIPSRLVFAKIRNHRIPNGLPTVEFDGKRDAILPEKDLKGAPYIEYIEKFPPKEDLPFDWIKERISQFVGTDKRPWLNRAQERSMTRASQG
ncbi:MAG: transglutaminase domain-containing protein [Deltaproteobacteria bacterium]|nr:transglutaminase domain-containing protein [Deltaproteobacteria bacterium]